MPGGLQVSTTKNIDYVSSSLKNLFSSLKLPMHSKAFFFYKNYYWKIHYKGNNVIILDSILKKALILDVIFTDTQYNHGGSLI